MTNNSSGDFFATSSDGKIMVFDELAQRFVVMGEEISHVNVTLSDYANHNYFAADMGYQTPHFNHGECLSISKESLANLDKVLMEDSVYIRKTSRMEIHNEAEFYVIKVSIHHENNNWDSAVDLYEYSLLASLRTEATEKAEAFADSLMNLFASMLMMSGRVVYVNDKEFLPEC